jgi:hypothetical protein
MGRLTISNFAGEAPLGRSRGERFTGAELALDVDLSNGTLRPLHTDTKVSPRDGNTVFIEDCCTQVYPGCVTVARVPVPCVRYFRTGVNGYLEDTGTPCGNWCRSGFPCLDRAPIVVLGGSTKTEQKVIERSYFYTYIKADGSESMPSQPSQLVLADWDINALVSGFETPEANYCITGIKIYSTAPGMATQDTPQHDNTSYFHVATLALGTSAYTHQPLSTSYGDAWLANRTGGPAPDNLTDVQYWDGSQLAGIADGVLHFTYPREFQRWAPEFALKPFEKPIRFLAAHEFGYLLNCGRPEVVDLRLDCKGGFCHNVQRLDEYHPLIGLRSPAIYQSNVVYASDDGLVMLSGNQSAVITGGFWSRDQWLALHPNTMVGVVHDGFYYGFTDVETIRVKLPGTTHSRDQNSFVTRLSIRARHAYVAESGVLYYLASDGSGIYSLGTGAGFKEYTWRSWRVRQLGHTHFSHAMVDTREGAPVNLTVFNVCKTGETELHLAKCKKARLPRWLKLDEIQVEVHGKNEVFEVSFVTPFTHQYDAR